MSIVFIKTINTHADLYNVLRVVGVWRADVTESSVGSMIIVTIPPTCPNRGRLEKALYMTLPAYIKPIVVTKKQNWIKNRKKYTYNWRIV